VLTVSPTRRARTADELDPSRADLTQYGAEAAGRSTARTARRYRTKSPGRVPGPLGSVDEQPPRRSPRVELLQVGRASGRASHIASRRTCPSSMGALTAFGRPRHPRLRVCFALLAGLTPLHGERFAARGGLREKTDPDVFVETSSYGPTAVDAIVHVLGVDAVAQGSDRPYARPPRHPGFGLGGAAAYALDVANPRRLLTGRSDTQVESRLPGPPQRPPPSRREAGADARAHAERAPVADRPMTVHDVPAPEDGHERDPDERDPDQHDCPRRTRRVRPPVPARGCADRARRAAAFVDTAALDRSGPGSYLPANSSHTRPASRGLTREPSTARRPQRDRRVTCLTPSPWCGCTYRLRSDRRASGRYPKSASSPQGNRG